VQPTLIALVKRLSRHRLLPLLRNEEAFMPNSPEPTETDATELLVRKYELLKQEALVVFGFYKGHIKSFQIMVGVIVSAVGITSAVKNSPLLEVNEVNWWIWLIGATIFWAVVQYLAFDILDSLYHLVLLGERLYVLENCINKAYGKTLLIWESRIVPKYLAEPMPSKGVINPNVVSSVLGILLLGVTAALPGYIYYKILNHHRIAAWIAIIFSVLPVAFYGYCYWKVLRKTRGLVRTEIEQLIEKPLDKPQSSSSA
jgi:hypothetical protein